MTPSPYYNSLLLEDLHMMTVLSVQNQTLGKYHNLRSAILLLKKWLSARNLLHEGGLSCAVAVFACHAVRKASLSWSTPTLQLFKLVLNSICTAFADSSHCPREDLLVGPTGPRADNDSAGAAARPKVGPRFGAFRRAENKRVDCEGVAEILADNSVLSGGEKNAAAADPFAGMGPMERAIAEAEMRERAEASAVTTPSDNGVFPTDPLNLFVNHLNVFQKCSPNLLVELEIEAKATLKNLEEAFDHSFEQIFGSHCAPALHWDCAVEVRLDSPADRTPEWALERATRQRLKEDRSSTIDLSGVVSLKKSLKKRKRDQAAATGQPGETETTAKAALDFFQNPLFAEEEFCDAPVAMQIAERLAFSLKAGLEHRLLRFWTRISKDKVTVGVKLHPKNIEKRVLKGPAANADPKTLAAYKALWGSVKPEVRRFNNGEILYATVWEQGRNIATQILDHLVAVHFPGAGRRIGNLSMESIGEDQLAIWKSFEE